MKYRHNSLQKELTQKGKRPISRNRENMKITKPGRNYRLRIERKANKMMNQDTIERMEKILDEKMRAQTEELKKYIDNRSSETEGVMEESESRLTEEFRRQRQKNQ